MSYFLGLHQNRAVAVLAFVSVFFVLSGCKHHDDAKKNQSAERIVIAKSQVPVQKLYYSGTLSPIATTPVISPFAGNVQEIKFAYGERVTKNQELLTIDSSALADDYRKAVSDYIQKKQSFGNNQLSFVGTQALYKAGIIPENQYQTEKTQHDNSALDFLQSQYQLEKVMHLAHVDAATIEKLSIADTQKVSTILQRHFHNIPILAPSSGIVLYPAASSDSSGNGSASSDDKQLIQGSSIKQDQLLLSIGDLKGLSAEFAVSEIDIDRIKKGMTVKVTSQAFPHIVLTGVIDSVSFQATQAGGSGGGLSMFKVTIKIPDLSSEAKAKIRVGMSGKFEIDISSAQEVMLPVEAVFQQKGQSMVTIVDEKGEKKTVPVVTGPTTPTSVVIYSGVKSGDRVLLHD